MYTSWSWISVSIDYVCLNCFRAIGIVLINNACTILTPCIVTISHWLPRQGQVCRSPWWTLVTSIFPIYHWLHNIGDNVIQYIKCDNTWTGVLQSLVTPVTSIFSIYYWLHNTGGRKYICMQDKKKLQPLDVFRQSSHILNSKCRPPICLLNLRLKPSSVQTP